MAKEVRLQSWKNTDPRLDGCQRDVEVWQRILQLRSMVLTPKDDMKTWLNFADLCRTSDRLTLADKTISALVGHNAMDPDVSRCSWTALTIDTKSGTARSHLCLLASTVGFGIQGDGRRRSVPVERVCHWVFERL